MFLLPSLKTKAFLHTASIWCTLLLAIQRLANQLAKCQRNGKIEMFYFISDTSTSVTLEGNFFEIIINP